MKIHTVRPFTAATRLLREARRASMLLAVLAGLGCCASSAGAQTLSINNVTFDESDSGFDQARFTVTLSAASTQAVSVNYATTAGTATAGTDFVAVQGASLQFAPGTLTQEIAVPIKEDTEIELDESFTISLSEPVGATLSSSAIGTATIVDDDVPTVSIDNVSVTEGDTGTKDATFTVTLSAPSPKTISLKYATRDISPPAPPAPRLAGATAGKDYTSIAPTALVFEPNQTTKTLTVAVLGDLDAEEVEAFAVALSNPGNVALGENPVGVGTIADNEIPTPSISDIRVTEANLTTPTPNSVAVTFAVRLTRAPDSDMTFKFATADGTALASVGGDSPKPGDYQATSGTLTFAKRTETFRGDTVKTVTVLIDSGTEDAAEEYFLLQLTDNQEVPVAVAEARCTISKTAPFVGASASAAIEGNTGVSPLDVTLRLSGFSAETVTVTYSLSDGTAKVGEDYAAPVGSTTVTFLPGESEKKVSVNLLGDLLDEEVETFVLTLSSPTNATLGDFSIPDPDAPASASKTIAFKSAATASIYDNDPVPRLSIADVQVNEGNSLTTTATFTVTLSTASAKTITVDYKTENQTSISTADYTALASGTLTFAPGDTQKTISVTVKGDTAIELVNETFLVRLSNAVNTLITRDAAVGTILEDDFPALTINDVIVTEGDSGQKNAVFTLKLSKPSPNAVSVLVATVGSSASSGTDFSALSRTVTFAPGQLTQTVAVAVTGDLLNEALELFYVKLSNPRFAIIADAAGTGTITDNDPQPVISVDDIRIVEGNSGTLNAIFTARLSAPSGKVVSVKFATANGTATAPADYTARALTTLTFNSGVTERNFSIPVVGDTAIELDETFLLNLSAPVNATLARAQAVATIDDSADRPKISVAGVTVTEGDTGSVGAVFRLALTKASPFPVSITVATVNGTAIEGSDYTAVNRTVTIPAGSLSAEVEVPVLGDTAPEMTETFQLRISDAVNAVIATGTANGVIRDTDIPTVSVEDLATPEPGSGSIAAQFTLRLSAPISNPVTVKFTTSAASPPNAATPGTDYTSVSRTVTFPAGTTVQTSAVPILADSVEEPDESFLVTLSSPSRATIAVGQAVGIIGGKTVPPTVSIGDVTLTEGNSGSAKQTRFAVTLSRASTRVVTVFYATANISAGQGSAADGGDYVAQTGSLQFAPGVTTQYVDITVNGDNRIEGDETFAVDLSIPVNATLGDRQAIGSITNDD
ncbi:MAG TPA: Calx-beta domain-containing protein [Abditibacteriaceae bacterium]|jgi:hypothetical protein